MSVERGSARPMRREPHLSVEPKFFLEDWPRRT